MSNSIPSSTPAISDDAAACVATERDSTDMIATVTGTTEAPSAKSTPTGHKAGRSSRETTRKNGYVQIARVPLVPEKILREHNAFCVIDTRFRAAARLLQCLWLRDHNIPTASSEAGDAAAGVSTLGNILSPKAADAGLNFLSKSSHRLALKEWLMCEADAAYDSERLFNNSLSSAPLCFSLFEPMVRDLNLATTVFRALLGDFVDRVEKFSFETAPLGRRSAAGLMDRTAFDLAAHFVSVDGKRGTIFIEVKYSESMEGPAARMRDRYNEASKEVRLYHDPDSLILRAAPINQFWREGMTAQLAVDRGITPKAVFLAIGPQLNSRVQGAFKVYQGELIEPDQQEPGRVPFIPMTLETVIRAIADAGATDHARALWNRYCDFERLYRLSMEKLAGDASSAPAPTARLRTNTQPPVMSSARRGSASKNARRTRATSSQNHRDTKVTKMGTTERNTP